MAPLSLSLKVAILSTSSFNAPLLVGMTSLTFGHSGAEKSLSYCETRRKDVNHDKIPSSAGRAKQPSPME